MLAMKKVSMKLKVMSMKVLVRIKMVVLIMKDDKNELK